MSKYVRDNSHSRYEAYTKEEMDNLLNKKVEEAPSILSGTSEPDSSLGKDGDIYLKYE